MSHHGERGSTIVWRHRWRAMGSNALAAVVGPPRLLGTTVEMVAAIEQRWSRFIADSDICRLNAAGGRPVVVDPLTVRLVTTMAEASALTNGRFDPTLLAPLVGLGYRSPVDSPTPAAAGGERASLVTTGVAGIRIGAGGAPIVALPAGTTIDAGGIGKGLAADICVERLLAAGATAALVSLGGDVAIGGEHPWTVAVGAPSIPELSGPLATLRLRSGGVATSGCTARRWQHHGRAVHHLLDPSTAAPTPIVGRAIIQATVAADHGRWAEALATEAIVGGEAAIDDFDRRGIAALVVRADGSQRATSTWEQVLAA